MKKLLLGLLALYLCGVAVVTIVLFLFETASSTRLRRVVELGEQHAPLPGAAQPPLKEACAGKLTPGGPRTIASYVAKMDPAKRPSLEKEYWHVDQTVLGVHDIIQLELTDHFLEPVSDPSLGQALQIALDPTSWSNRVRWAYLGHPELRETKYLVVARYASLTLPSVDGNTFEPGAGDFGARVLAFPSGEVLCEGRGRVEMMDRVTGSGRGSSDAAAKQEASESARKMVPFVFTKAVTASPLNALCATGGDALCGLTAYWISSH